MDTLVKYLVENHFLRSKNLIEAFQKAPRYDFMLEEDKDYYTDDTPFPIGHEVTISQPRTVAFMMEHLDPKQGNKILDIGFGSGWTTAILANAVGAKGKVYAIEIIPEVFAFGKKNVERLGIKNIEFILGDGSGGWQKAAPYNAILGSAMLPKVPKILKDQLKVGGRMVAPTGTLFASGIIKLVRTKKEYEEEYFPGFSFVGMRGKYGI